MTILFSILNLLPKSVFFPFFLVSLFGCASASYQALQGYNEAIKCEEKGDTERSILLYEESLRESPSFHKARFNLTLLLTKRQNWEEVQKNLAILEKDLPQNFHLLKMKAFVLQSKGDFESAYNLYKELAEALPTNVQILYNLAYLSWHFKRDAGESGELLRRIQRIDQRFVWTDKPWIQELGYDPTV